MLAEVCQNQDPSPTFRLQRVGLGLCVPVDGVDTVVCDSVASASRDSLGLVGRRVLPVAEEELRKARLIARTPTCAVVAAPTTLRVDEAHQKTTLVYVLLVDPLSGRLQTLIWAIDCEPGRKSAPETVTLLPPDLVFRCGLDVCAERILGTIPVKWSFAMRALPPGLRLKNSDGLRPWTTDPRKIEDRPSAFEAEIRRFLAGVEHTRL
jgi:hypothetical protein